MELLHNGITLLTAGIVLMAAAAVLAVVSLIVFRITGKRLKQKLEAEYGKKRR